MIKKKSQVKTKSLAVKKTIKTKGSVQSLHTKKLDGQTNTKSKKPDSVNTIKNQAKVLKKSSNVKKEDSMIKKAEIKEKVTKTIKNQAKVLEKVSNVKKKSSIIKKAEIKEKLTRTTKNQAKVSKKAPNVKKKNLIINKAEFKEQATQAKKNSANLVELEVDGAFVLCERHKHTIDEVILCLESETPFCFLRSEVASYLEYYKEAIIDRLKSNGEIVLLFFDPKFGDDLSAILNKELANIDMSVVGSNKISGARKILVVDNESFAKSLDWELIDSLRLELKAANFGAFSIDPRSDADGRGQDARNAVSSFQSFELPKMSRKELKILKEYISTRPEKSVLADKLLRTSSGKEVKGQVSSETDQNSILQKLGKLISRK